MDLEEARKVIWLRSNPRSLGELLDEGYLTASRLEWASMWAYNSNLQQAAKVILESLQKPSTPATGEEERIKLSDQNSNDSLPIGVSLETARATRWPMPPYKGQSMGSLVDSRQLNLKDLGYAIENAYDEKVRKAAIALALVRLEQVVKEPAPLAGFIKVIKSRRSYSQKIQSRLILLEGTIYGGLITFFLVLSGYLIINNFNHPPNSKNFAEFFSSPYELFLVLVLLALFAFIFWLPNFLLDQISKKIDKEIESYRLGDEGEEKVVQLILQTLDGRWNLYQNISLPGRNKGDLDIVLVGPPGVWVLEVKNLKGEYRNIGDSWEYRHDKKWKIAKGNPSRQALNNAVRLKNFLMADNIKVFVNPVVVWANEENHLKVENPSTSVWLYDRLPDELGNIWQAEKLSEEDRKKIADKFQKLIESEKKLNK